MTKQQEEKTAAQYIPFPEAEGLVRRQLKRALDGTAPLMREYTGYLSGPQGKFIRAQALISCAQEADGTVSEDAVKLAAAVEVLHLATLVHDDVIDDADARRGEETLQKKYGKKKAVICGDYLLCAALAMAAGISNREEYLDLAFPNYVRRICLGEMHQLVHHKNLSLTVRQYLKTISGKTAALFEASFFAGGVLCKAEKKTLAQYRQLGRNIGMIFQMTDDCMDYEASRDLAQKPVQSDFEQGVITLPLIYALREKNVRAQVETGEIQNGEVKALVETAGGIAYTRAMAKRYYDKSLQILGEMPLHESKRGMLLSILNKAMRMGG